WVLKDRIRHDIISTNRCKRAFRADRLFLNAAHRLPQLPAYARAAPENGRISGIMKKIIIVCLIFMLSAVLLLACAADGGDGTSSGPGQEISENFSSEDSPASESSKTESEIEESQSEESNPEESEPEESKPEE